MSRTAALARALEGLAYLALTCLLTWPLAARLSTALPGALPESGQFVWAMHAALQALRLPADPLLTKDLFAPAGTSLVLHTALLGPALLLSPITLLWGPVVAANLWVLLCLVLSACCAAALARRLDVAAPVAWWCGVAVSFCPFVAARLGGHFNLLALWEVLLAWLLARRARGAPAAALAWGLLLAFTLLTDYQLALFAAGASVLALLPRGSPTHPRARAAAALLCAAPLPAAVCAVLALHLRAVGGLAPIPGSDATAALAYRVYLRGLLTPAAAPAATSGMEHVGYPGAVVLYGCLLAVLFCLRPTRFARRALPPLLLALVCALLALGPTLALDARTTLQLGGTPIFLPYALLLLLGVADVMREPARFVLPMTIAAAATAALALDVLARAVVLRVPRRAGSPLLWCAVALLVAVTLADTWTGPLALAPLPPLRDDPALVALRALPPGVVLDLPTARVTGQWHIGCRYETLDDLIAVLGDHPLVGGYLSRAPLSAAYAVLGSSGLMALQPRATLACDEASFPGGLVAPPRPAAIGPALRLWQVRAVLLAPAAYAPRELPALSRLLVRAGYRAVLLGRPARRYLLYALSRPV